VNCLSHFVNLTQWPFWLVRLTTNDRYRHGSILQSRDGSTFLIVAWPTTSCFADWSKRRHVEHYRLFTASRSTVRQFNVWRQTLNCLTATRRSLYTFYTVNVIHILRCFCLRFVCFALPPYCRQFSHAAILWVNLSETPPFCRKNSHVAILVIRQNIIMTHSRSWDMENMTTLGWQCSTSGRHISMSHSLPFVIC